MSDRSTSDPVTTQTAAIHRRIQRSRRHATKARAIFAVLAAAIGLLAASGGSAEQATSSVLSVEAGRIDAGFLHSCAIVDDDTVRCWGHGGHGGLGYGNTNDIGDDETPGSAGPVDLGTGRTAKAVGTGRQHTCAILDDDGVRCWGAGNNGRLGYGNTNVIGDDEVPGSVGPVDLGAGRTAGAITAAADHTCAILDDDTVRCWGSGDFGQLGYATGAAIGDDETPGSVGPVDIGAGRTAKAITAADLHTCAVLDDGSVRCWGYGANGRLGYGHGYTVGDDETPGTVAPVDLGVGRTAKAVSAGGHHTCAVLDDGSVRCWGHGNNGRLGYGNTNDIGDDETPGTVGPVDLGVGHTANAVSAGEHHTCALLDDGSVRCWGYANSGRLGYGNANDIGDDETPGTVGPVDLGAGRTAKAIAAGNDHTCAILDDDTVRCWGGGTFGRLGYGNTNDIGDDETPDSAGPVDFDNTPLVAAGAANTCAVLDDASARCWGAGSSGQLGLGYATTTAIGNDETPGSAGPIDVGTGRTAKSITPGGTHVCSVLDDDSVRCWGNGNNGRLGYGNTNKIGDDETPGTVGPVDLGVGRTAKDVSAGTHHTCAILDDDRVRCWGHGNNGRLGYGDTNDIGDDEVPGAVAPVDLEIGRTAKAVSAGTDHTCAILDDDTVRCWGFGALGQLGYGNTNDVGDDEVPGSVATVDLGGGRTAKAIAAGNNHTCAILDNDTVRCWGSGAFGQLGYANTTTVGDDETPASVGSVDLGPGRTAIAIVAGDFYTCALLDDDTVRCWGSGGNGRLGYGNTTTIGDDETPGSVGPLDLGAGRTATSVTAGDNHACASLDDDTVRCWGSSLFGVLGYGNQNTIGDNETPGSVGPVVIDNNAFTGAQVIRGASGSVAGTSLKASGDLGEPTNTSNSAPIESMWFSWTAPSTGVATFETCSSSFDTTLGAYSGAVLSGLTKLVRNNDGCLSDGSLLKFGAVGGTTYRISVDGVGTESGSFKLAWSLQPGFELVSTVRGRASASRGWRGSRRAWQRGPGCRPRPSPRFRRRTIGEQSQAWARGTQEENKALVRRFIDTLDTGDVAATTACFDADRYYSNAMEADLAGTWEQMKGAPSRTVVRRRREPDPYALVAEGDRVAYHTRMTATHVGELLGIPAEQHASPSTRCRSGASTATRLSNTGAGRSSPRRWRRPFADGDRQRPEGADEVVELAHGRPELEALDPRRQRREHGRALEPGQAHADAGVHAVAEAEVAGAVAGDVELVGPLPPALVAVRRGEAAPGRARPRAARPRPARSCPWRPG